jgi:uncharacterized protein YjiS (DUF1127 family)
MNSLTHKQPILAFPSRLHLIERLKKQPGILLAWHRRAQSRIALSKLDQHLLDDIGISAETAKSEAGKPFWKD